MRLQELIESAYAPINIDAESTNDLVEQVVGYIEDNCRFWFSEIGNKEYTVYRGISHEAIAFTRRVRSDRIPHDSSEWMHDLYNALIHMAGGSANRSNSAFVTSNPKEAAAYGHAYAVLPVGDFSYTWSPEWIDWYQNIEADENSSYNTKLAPMLKDEVKEKLRAVDFNNPEYTDILDSAFSHPGSYDPEKVKRYIYCDRGLRNAVQEGHEIMLSCDTLLYVDAEVYRSKVLPLL